MVPPRFKLYGAVYLILCQDDQVLLLRRYKTGWQDGNYSLVAGHIDGDESFISAMCRESKEEAGIIIKPKDLKFVHAQNRLSNDSSREYIDIAFSANTWEGKVTNMEPSKCDDLSWFSFNSLPKNIVPNVAKILDCYKRNIYYSELGWE